MTIIRSMVWILSIACSNRIPAPNASCSPNSDPWKSSTWATPMILENNQNKSDSNWKLQYLYTMLMWQLCLIYSKPSKNIYHSLKEEIRTAIDRRLHLPMWSQLQTCEFSVSRDLAVDTSLTSNWLMVFCRHCCFLHQ